MFLNSRQQTKPSPLLLNTFFFHWLAKNFQYPPFPPHQMLFKWTKQRDIASTFCFYRKMWNSLTQPPPSLLFDRVDKSIPFQRSPPLLIELVHPFMWNAPLYPVQELFLQQESPLTTLFSLPQSHPSHSTINSTCANLSTDNFFFSTQLLLEIKMKI